MSDIGIHANVVVNEKTQGWDSRAFKMDWTSGNHPKGRQSSRPPIIWKCANGKKPF